MRLRTFLVAMIIATLMLVSVGCSQNKAYVEADAANFNATYPYAKAGIDSATNITSEDKDDLHLTQALRADRIKRNGGKIVVDVYDPTLKE